MNSQSADDMYPAKVRVPSLNCRNGHPRSEYGFEDVNGKTQCRECRRLNHARYAARQAVARAEAKREAA